jgi:hypothetical protein
MCAWTKKFKYQEKGKKEAPIFHSQYTRIIKPDSLIKKSKKYLHIELIKKYQGNFEKINEFVKGKMRYFFLLNSRNFSGILKDV